MSRRVDPHLLRVRKTLRELMGNEPWSVTELSDLCFRETATRHSTRTLNAALNIKVDEAEDSGFRRIMKDVVVAGPPDKDGMPTFRVRKMFAYAVANPTTAAKMTAAESFAMLAKPMRTKLRKRIAEVSVGIQGGWAHPDDGAATGYAISAVDAVDNIVRYHEKLLEVEEAHEREAAALAENEAKDLRIAELEAQLAEQARRRGEPV